MTKITIKKEVVIQSCIKVIEYINKERNYYKEKEIVRLMKRKWFPYKTKESAERHINETTEFDDLWFSFMVSTKIKVEKLLSVIHLHENDTIELDIDDIFDIYTITLCE